MFTAIPHPTWRNVRWSCCAPSSTCWPACSGNTCDRATVISATDPRLLIKASVPGAREIKDGIVEFGKNHLRSQMMALYPAVCPSRARSLAVKVEYFCDKLNHIQALAWLTREPAPHARPARRISPRWSPPVGGIDAAPGGTDPNPAVSLPHPDCGVARRSRARRSIVPIGRTRTSGDQRANALATHPGRRPAAVLAAGSRAAPLPQVAHPGALVHPHPGVDRRRCHPAAREGAGASCPGPGRGGGQ